MISGRYDMKKQVKVAWAGFSTYSRLSDMALRVRKWVNRSAPVAIITYHRVMPYEMMGEVYSSSQIITSLEDFKKQIRFLVHHYRVLSLESLAGLPDKGSSLPPKCVIVTFDDGWRDNYRYAFPVLRKYRIPATIFLTTGFVGHRHIFWQEQLRFLLHTLSGKALSKGKLFPKSLAPWQTDLIRIADRGYSREKVKAILQRLKDQGESAGASLVSALDSFLGHPDFPVESHAFLSWNQVRTMAAEGIFFGSHTCRHRLLNMISDKEVEVEITESKKRLEAELGREISTFAYPSGMYRPQIFEQLRRAGYRLAVTTDPGLNFRHTPPFQLKRVNMESGRFQGTTGQFSESLFAVRLAGML